MRKKGRKVKRGEEKMFGCFHTVLIYFSGKNCSKFLRLDKHKSKISSYVYT